MPLEVFDLAIIGAGIHGLSMLKAYRDVHPNASIVVLDKGNSIGGVWAKDRLYPGLHTNNHFNTFEFSDLKMSTQGYNPARDHIPGEHVNEYLQQYAKEFGLHKYIRPGSRVISAFDEGEDGWMVSIEQNYEGKQRRYHLRATKMVVATGLTSEPFVPTIDGEDDFGAPIYHTSQLVKAEDGLGTFKKVAILSGAKFSWDIACAYASAGVQVDWVIRESGHGPCWMMPNNVTPLKIDPALLLQTRLMTWLSPCIWDDGFAWARNFFYKTWLGKLIAETFFAGMQRNAEKKNAYDSHPETKKLKPWDDLFFIGTNRGLLNYDVDFFDFVRNGQIRVHVADISHLSDHKVHLSNGYALEADVLICGTGWQDTPQLNFVTKKELGLPGRIAPSARKHVQKADSEIIAKFPKLQNQPIARQTKPMSENKVEASSEPYRLYRFMVPPGFVDSRNLAFAGSYRSAATTNIAQTQALWITAFFDNQIPALKNLDDNTNERLMYETVLHTQFGKWRHSRGFGARSPELWYDCLPYVDLMLKDIGIQNQRKKSWFAERFTPYMPEDYIGIIDEYKALKAKRS